MKKFRKLQDGLSFFFLGRFIIETKLNNSIDEANYKNNSNLSSLLNDLIAK